MSFCLSCLKQTQPVACLARFLQSDVAFTDKFGSTLTGLRFLDPLVSVFIGLLILWSAWGIVRESMDILLEGTPHDVDMRAMVADLLRVPGVCGVHDLHVWSITHDMRALSAHVVTDDVSISAGAAIQSNLNEVLAHKYHIAHATLQLECEGCQPDLLYCDLTTGNHNHAPEASVQSAEKP